MSIGDGRHRDRPGHVEAVSGRPRQWLRVDGAVLFAGSIGLFATAHQPCWPVPRLIVAPDACMLGPLHGSRVGALADSGGHPYLLPAAVGGAGHSPPALAVGAPWFAHVGIDRLAGYGLKYDTDFADTHLGRLAGATGRSPVRCRPGPGRRRRPCSRRTA